jgi:DNA-binding response OmpR family regulator
MARILLLEDDVTFRDLVATALKRANHEVTSCADGQMGWDAMDRAQPDLIILDLAMPRLDGLSFLRRLRAEEKWNLVSVLVVSANSSAASIAVERGAQGYLLKSRFSMPELLETVQSLTAAAEKRRGTAA